MTGNPSAFPGVESAAEWQSALEAGAKEMQRGQEQFFNFGKDSVEEWAKAADSAARDFSVAMDFGGEQVRSALEASNAAAEMAKAIGNELYGFANALFSEQVEHSRNLVNCRTANEVFELQSIAVKGNMDMLFNEAMRLSDMVLKYAAEASEPISNSISSFSKQLAKNSKAA